MARVFAVIVLLIALAGGAFLLERANFTAAGPDARTGNSTIVLIAPHDRLWTIAQKLQDAGAVNSALLFALGVRLRAETLEAGEYAIPSQASLRDVAAILVSGKAIKHKLTAAEGLTSQMILALIAADTVLVGDAGPVPVEGTLLPETYLFLRGTTRAELVVQMQAAQAKFVAAQWAARAPDLPFKTMHDAIVLASIVEKETGIAEERRHIASVFVNRLRQGMKLESDPTVIYGISKGYPLGRGIRVSELAALTPYNTYAVAGLPPTPICNPGKDAIAAVLNPEVSSDLYFVADGTGGHVFAATLAQHQRNVLRWRQIEHAAVPNLRR